MNPSSTRQTGAAAFAARASNLFDERVDHDATAFPLRRACARTRLTDLVATGAPGA
ncbi:hypothetical protein [Asaia bogorensis]|uniref:hypothetical protein n=1 Tax=Asaia bogorensis TaxID=91915 RepID=UPI001F090543|nr:hypothetical protein [Asaia bogorensis]